MTVVGKILVFLNLVFSLVVGTFAVMDYTARTHWVDGFTTLKARYEVLQGVSTTYRGEADKLAKEKQDLTDRFNKSGVPGLDPTNAEDGLRAADRAIAVLTEQGKTIEAMRKEIGDLRERDANAKSALLKAIALEKGMKADVEKRQGDATILHGHLKAETDKNFKLVKEMNVKNDELMQAQILASSFKARNEQLNKKLEDSLALLATKAGGVGNGAGPRGATPPPDNLEGLVRRADGNLVTISLGSDNGLARGNTLEVFRLGQNPKYIGKIKIVTVLATEAIGQTEGRMLAPIQVNDRVASKILLSP